MKKNLFLLFALICSVSLFTACSDDDPKNEDELISGPMVGTWQLADLTFGEPDLWGERPCTSGAVKITWETSDPKLTLPLLGFDTPIALVGPLVERKTSPMLAEVLKDVTLSADGTVLATYAKKTANADPEWLEAKDYATYKKVNDHQILLFLNLQKIMEKPATKAGEEALMELMGLVQNGIPVNVRYDEAGAPMFFIDKNLVEKVTPALTVLVNIVPETEQNKDMLNMAKTVLAQLPAILEKTTKMELGLQMKK